MSDTSVVGTFDESCVFCRIARGDFDTELVAESASVVAFHDINPVADVHVLVVPRQHFTTLHDVNDPTLYAASLSMVVEVATKLGLTETGYRLTSNNGAAAGQSVFHVHFHLTSGQHQTRSIA